MTIDAEHDETLAKLRAMFGEHYTNWTFVVLDDDDGEMYYDYSNWRVGKTLLSDAYSDLTSELEFGEVTVELEEGDEWKADG